MKVCILSDSHDNIPILCKAVEAAKAQGAEVVLHCGDVVAPSTINKLQRFELPIHVIHGNNTGDLYMMSKISHKAGSLIHYYGQDASFKLADKRIFLVHYPHYAKAMAVTGDYDLVCCGHTHIMELTVLDNIKGGKTTVCNPGTIGGVGAKATYVFGDLDTMAFEFHQIPKE